MVRPVSSGVLAGLTPVTTTRHGANGADAASDEVAVEEPLEIRVAGEAVAITMRTPGHDHELVAGFLLSEGVIDGRTALGSLKPCGDVDGPGRGNAIDALPAPGVVLDIDASRRGTLTTAACGVCGRRSIDDLASNNAPLRDDTRLSLAEVDELVSTLTHAQPGFARSGGLHAAGIARAGRFACVREDVGRHNAVDKAIGRMLLDDRLPLAGHQLVVSGRVSFEIVQKAWRAGVPMVVAISAPTSLAIATAERAGITLVGFARGGRCNVYSHPDRLGPG